MSRQQQQQQQQLDMEGPGGSTATLRAYAAAEERLLDIISPLSDSAPYEEEERQAIEEEQIQLDQEPDGPLESLDESVDPAVDNMMHIITNDSDIHSLISSADSNSVFKGFDDQSHYEGFVGGGQGQYIYGLSRNISIDNNEEAVAPDTGDQCDNYMDSTSSKAVHLTNDIIEIDDSPEVVRDSAMAFEAVANSQGMLTNGQDHHLIEDMELVTHTHENGEHMVDGTECVIYEEDMVVVTTEEHCCEIIVTTHGVSNEQEMARAFLMPGSGIVGSGSTSAASALLNGRVYVTEEETIVEMHTDGNNIFLNDANLGQPIMIQQHQNSDFVPEEDVEDPTFVDDIPLEEERPDICQVYDHELEDHDDEEIEEEQIHENPQTHNEHEEVGQWNINYEMHQQQDQGQEEQPILIASDVEEDVQQTQLQPQIQFHSKEQEFERSSPTEFPVSSSSPPNASDRDDDLDDDIVEHHSPAPRKYPPLLKNTLFAEAMDRRLAHICQSQPEMTLTEKIFAWETAVAHDCEGVEDVENFQAAFEKFEPSKEHNFVHFRECLERKLTRISQDMIQAKDTAKPAKRIQNKPKQQRRLLHTLPAEETIILDDDDEDCYEVTDKDKSSITTLIPEEELECEEAEIVRSDGLRSETNDDKNEPAAEPVPSFESDLKNTQTQTVAHQLTKETSTTDLANSQEIDLETGQIPLPTLPQLQTENDLCAIVRDVFRGVHPKRYLEHQFQQQEFQRQEYPQQDYHQHDYPQQGYQQQDYQQQDYQQQEYQQQEYQQQEYQQQEYQQQDYQQHEYQEQEYQQRGYQHQQQEYQRQQEQYPPQQQQYEPEMPQNPAKVTENTSSASYGDYPNDVMFYEQQEFCNYLGLTELATANAVASAMRELANSTVARRSLRVRPPQQLERMRSDVRGKHRRERQDKDKDKDKKSHNQMTTSSELSTDKNDLLTVPSVSEATLTAPANFDEEVKEQKDQQQTQSPTQMFDYYYRAQGDRSEGGGVKTTEETKPSHNKPQSVESAFAKVYAAAAPAELLESMQQRLRLAREVQPSIFIVQAMSNATASETKPPSAIEAVTFGQIDGPRPSLETANKVPQQQPQKKKSAASRSKRTKSQYHHHVEANVQSNAPIRRRTTVGGGAAHNVRDLVTRSTTHMNSKLLRNRKINLLKTYALSDATGPNTKKKRLSGGGGGSTGVKNRTPKTPKTKSSKKASPDHDEKLSPEQHRLHNQQSSVPPNTPRKSKNKAALEIEGSPSAVGNKHKKSNKSIIKRGRAKSLPTALTVNQMDEPVTDHEESMQFVESEPMPNKHKSLMDTYEFSTNHAVVQPPLWNDSTHSYVHYVHRANEMRHQAEVDMLGSTSLNSRLSNPTVLLGPPSPMRSPQPSHEPHFSRRRRQQAGTIQQEQSASRRLLDIQLTPPGGILRLSEASSLLRNPLAGKHGKVLYMYYELDQLIVLQERSITFWKYSKVFNVLNKSATIAVEQSRLKSPQAEPKMATVSDSENSSIVSHNPQTGQQWVNLGRVRRITNDIEIIAPFGNRLCVHNSTPVYIEMRCHPLDHHRREGKLMSLYVNVYYYCEEELRPKMHSVHLDAVNCEWSNVLYTSIAESRYFVMAYQAELMMGKPRSGICKYSLTPTLDTLASIREFKQLRHELKHIECLTEDRLIGYGVTRITIWDHRSGDTLMNYDLGVPLGRNLGAMHFPSFDMDQSSILILYQHIQVPAKPSQLHVIACELSHASPSHRLLHVHGLPSPQFDHIVGSINTGDHLILKSISDDEIWISAADPRQLTYVAPQGQGIQHFYARQKSQVVEVSPHSLTVDSIANHMLKMATQQQRMAMILRSVKTVPLSS